ncbi:MAG TPA: hypothetical protein VM121_08155 [Acidimicrobiales bacterium]|nr:hypothetical protein [Acidimicrobiales bacterium]
MLPETAVFSMRWPAFPNDVGSSLLALQQQFEESERSEPADIERRQLDALSRLLRHASKTVPHYRDQPVYADLAGCKEMTAAAWRQLPILTRPALQDAGDRMRSDSVPTDHLPTGEVVTTGSTGRPVRALTSKVTATIWLAITLRDSLWHKRDLLGRMAAIRADPAGVIPSAGQVLPNWNNAIASAYASGPCALLSIKHDVGTQAEWLAAQDPHYVLSYPSNLVAIADHFRAAGMKLANVRQVLTYGETLSPEMRATCREAWGVPVIDMYSAQEIGYMALQCPEIEQYHVQSEAAYVEVLDDAGQTCRPGDVGRVVISPLHNYATPFLRYEIGDFAEVGSPCPCGRTLPVLTRIVGRQRNVWTLPSGERVWPMFTSRKWGHISAVRQLQLVQHELDHIEARIVGPRPLTSAEELEFTTLLRDEFVFPFRLTITYLDEIDRSRSMKFEDFVSFIPARTG